MQSTYKNSIFIDYNQKYNRVDMELGLSEYTGTNPDFWLDMDVCINDSECNIIRSRLQTWESIIELPTKILKTEEEFFQYSLVVPSKLDEYKVDINFILMLHTLSYDIAYDVLKVGEYKELIKSYRELEITYTNHIVTEYNIC